MLKPGCIAAIAWCLLSAAPAIAQEHEVIDTTNPNNSSYPSSNGQNATPNEPDHVFGNASSTHKLPATDIPHKKGDIVYDPNTTQLDNDNRPSAPTANDDEVGTSNNSGMVIPIPSSGGNGKH